MVKEVGTDARSDLFFWSREPALFLLLVNSCFVFSHYSLKENSIHCCSMLQLKLQLESVSWRSHGKFNFSKESA